MELVGIEGDVVVLGKVTGQQTDEVDEDFLHTLGRLAVYDQGEKRTKRRNIFMLVSFQTTFVLSQIWIYGKNNVPLQHDNDISSFDDV